MSVRRIHVIQRLAVPLDQAWTFFSDPRNLVKLTPPRLGFEITSPVPERIYAGAIITYRLRPVAGVPVTWVTEITHVDPPVRFVDEQRLGPYRFWHHQHRFREVPEGVEMEDLVHYALPFGTAGRVIGGNVVSRHLDAIFAYRRRVLDTLFSSAPRLPARVETP